jgi:3-mercaptopyruvate sulfurtransferase SseA
MMRKVSSMELTQRLGDKGLLLVDVRPMAAYNGWRLQGEARGGHIRGAIACPLSWLDEFEPAALKRLLASKGLRPDRTIIFYGYSPEESALAAEKLVAIGYPEVYAAEVGYGELAADATLPVDRLPHYEKLVYPQWLHALMAGENTETYTGNPFALYHVNFGVPDEYALGHIPGAVHLDTNTLESETDWNRCAAAELEAALLAYGIRHDTTVILYGRDQAPGNETLQPGQRAGQIAAIRAGAILMYAGVKDVRLLDGGYDAWVAAGYEVESSGNLPVPVNDFGVEIPAHPDYFIDIEAARALLADPNAALVSIRSWAEYIGDVSGYNYIGPRGRIAGAVWGNCGSDAYHMQHYRNLDNTMRPYDEIEANWREAGVTPDKQIAFYCGTGWRASETFFYAHLMDWPRVAIYDGGWFEWSRDPANPIETGIPESGSFGALKAP